MNPVRKRSDNIIMKIERYISMLSKVANRGLLAFFRNGMNPVRKRTPLEIQPTMEKELSKSVTPSLATPPCDASGISNGGTDKTIMTIERYTSARLKNINNGLLAFFRNGMNPVRKRTDKTIMTIERYISILSKGANHGLLAF
jgi:hypothetical protein